MSGKLLQAIEFSRIAHKGQKRKYTGEDYVWHPIEVARIMTSFATEYTEDMLIAAILHDTIEDTNAEYDDILTAFGKHVADMVNDLTDVSHAGDGVRWVRKEIDREHTAKASPQAKTIKLADLISNSSSILEHDVEFAKVYIKEKELLLEVLTEGDSTLYGIAKDIVTLSKQKLSYLERAKV